MTKLYEEATQLLKDMGDDDIIQVVQYIRMIKLSKNNDKNKSMKDKYIKSVNKFTYKIYCFIFRSI